MNEKSKYEYLLRVLLFLCISFFFVSVRHLKKKFDLVHVHSVPDFEVLAAIVPKLAGAKIILDIHDIVPEFFASKFHKGADSYFSKILELVERICCAFSDHVIISNHIWGERLMKRSVRNDKCTVLINYPDISRFRRTRAKSTINKFILLYPGTIAWHQGLDIAVRALQIVRTKYSTVELHIYGKGPEEKNLMKLVDELQLLETVKIFNILPVEGIVEKMMDADIGIVPKRNDSFGGEAFSTKILEFMAMDMPVIASRTRIDEYYFKNSEILFFENENHEDLARKILLLHDNPSEMHTLIKNGKEFVAKNNWRIKEQEYLSIIQSLLKKRREAGAPV